MIQEFMTLPKELNMLIELSLQHIANDPYHHLNLGYREAIYLALGPQLFSQPNDNSGYLRRIRLAKTSVLFVLSAWNNVWPQDNTIESILHQIEVVSQLRGTIDEGKIAHDIEQRWDYVTELTDQTRNMAGVGGMAAVAAYSLALWDGFNEADDIDYQRPDSTDFMLNDVHFYASTVYAEGPPYPIALAPKPNNLKRLAFWTWWLREAIPTIW